MTEHRPANLADKNDFRSNQRRSTTPFKADGDKKPAGVARPESKKIGFVGNAIQYGEENG